MASRFRLGILVLILIALALVLYVTVNDVEVRHPAARSNQPTVKTSELDFNCHAESEKEADDRMVAAADFGDDGSSLIFFGNEHFYFAYPNTWIHEMEKTRNGADWFFGPQDSDERILFSLSRRESLGRNTEEKFKRQFVSGEITNEEEVKIEGGFVNVVTFSALDSSSSDGVQIGTAAFIDKKSYRYVFSTLGAKAELDEGLETILSSFSFTLHPDFPKRNDYYVRGDIDGRPAVFSEGTWRDPAPRGYMQFVAAHNGNTYISVDISAGSEEGDEIDEYVHMSIKTAMMDPGTYHGYFAHRSNEFWYQGECEFTFVESNGYVGDLRGSAECEQLADIRDKGSGKNETISNLEFFVGMRGVSCGIE